MFGKFDQTKTNNNSLFFFHFSQEINKLYNISNLKMKYQVDLKKKKQHYFYLPISKKLKVQLSVIEKLNPNI